MCVFVLELIAICFPAIYSTVQKFGGSNIVCFFKEINTFIQ